MTRDKAVVPEEENDGNVTIRCEKGEFYAKYTRGDVTLNWVFKNPPPYVEKKISDIVADKSPIIMATKDQREITTRIYSLFGSQVQGLLVVSSYHEMTINITFSKKD